MTIRTRDEAMRVALNTTHNPVGACQAVVRGWFNAASAGDFDGDGAADAEDGWKKEPAWAKHVGDRTPPAGVPLSFLGGSHDNGHRALSLPHGKVRSTDFSTHTQSWSPGVVGTANSIHEVESAMGVSYAGWSETIDGFKIPKPPPPTRGPRVERALTKLRRAENHEPAGTVRKRMLKAAIAALEKIPFINR